MNAAAIKALQKSLGLTQTGVLTEREISAMNKAVTKAVTSNKDIARYAGTNSPDQILNAYMTGDWSGIVGLTGKPFTKEQQQAAVSDAEKALAPAYKAQTQFDEAEVADALQDEADAYSGFLKADEEAFKDNKEALDQNAADQGILFTGARHQKLNDLRTTFADRAAMERTNTAKRIESRARSHQYAYGNEGAERLGDYYRLGETPAYNANVAGGVVTPNKSLSSVYNPSAYKFQGTKPVAQKSAVQTRAASLLANKANKLTSLGYQKQF